MKTLRDIAVAALIGAGITFALGGVYIARADTCTEDMPCWNPTMGNGAGTMRCDVTVADGQIYLDECAPVSAR